MGEADKRSRNMHVSKRKKFSVVVVSALFTIVAFSVMIVPIVRAMPPTWIPPITIKPSAIYPGETFNGETNFTHPDDPGSGDVGDLNSGRIFIETLGMMPCQGVNDTATVDPPGGIIPVYRVHVDNYNPANPPFSLGPGSYSVYFYFADVGGNGTCSDSARLDILAPDSKPPWVAGHGEVLYADPPYFNVNPVPIYKLPWGNTFLIVVISDEWTGNSLITDGEYFVCGPSDNLCGPYPSWTNDSGNKLSLISFWPWGDFPWPDQHWDEYVKVMTQTRFNVTSWGLGTFWVWIHGADCGEDGICQGGAPGSDDNWGNFWNTSQKDAAWYVIGLEVISGKNPPTLNWTDEPGYETDGVDPDIGSVGDWFTYRVNYTDSDNDAPTAGYPKLYVQMPPGTNILGSPFTMDPDNSSDVNYKDGKLYGYSVQLNQGSNVYCYYFEAYDGYDWAVGPATYPPCHDGPDVTTSNNAPTLDWTGQAGYTTDGVNPDTGGTSTIFEYRVKYMDADNEAPATGYPKLYINKAGIGWNSSPFVMNQVDPSDITYTDGKLYTYSTTLSPAGSDYCYYFEATDGKDWATGPPTYPPCHAGPTVTNQVPTLNWTGEVGYTTDGVNPDSGLVGDTFTYRVKYTDADNDPPASGYPKLYINKPAGIGWGIFVMNQVDPSDVTYTDGKLYTYSVALIPAGTDYCYYFEATDGIDWATGAPTYPPCHDGPDVNPPPPPSAPTNLWVERANPNIIVHWDAVPGAAFYNVYRASFRAAPFPSGWTVASGVSGTSWVHSGGYADDFPWYYIVRAYTVAGSESANSTMGMKEVLLFGMTNPDRNINWISLPYHSIYEKASDITDELGPTKIDVVGKWDPARQKAIVYYYGKGKWRGRNFDINPGDGIFINSVNPSLWSWKVNGTDFSKQLSFTHNPIKGNINWISLPYSSKYMSASDIVMDIEGSLASPPTKIKEVGYWDPGLQDVSRFYWNSTAGQWEGIDFDIIPWLGIYLDILTSFTWTPKLITPSVP